MTVPSFLTKRKGSQNWQLELRFPKDFKFVDVMTGGAFGWQRHFIKSLGTPNRDEAEILAAPYIHRFRLAIYSWRFRSRHMPTLGEALAGKPDPDDMPLQPVECRQYEDGLRVIDGQTTYVDGAQITYFGLDGKPVRKGDNPLVRTQHAPYVDDAMTAAAVRYFEPTAVLPSKFAPKLKDKDADLLDAYLAGKRKEIQADARSTLDFYKRRIGKPFEKTTRKDGKHLARLLAEEGFAKATVQKKVGWLAAAVNHAISEDAFTGVNPFLGVMSVIEGEPQTRAPLSEEHMRLCWSALSSLSHDDQLLWKLLAKTGMRLGEAMSIKSEESERGTRARYVKVGTKNESSKRPIPIPVNIGMPDEINGPLFGGTAPAASKRLNRFIKASIPNWTPDLVVHSLRHRAIDVFRLTSKGDPFLRRRLVGHTAKDVHDVYGGWIPMARLMLMLDANIIDGSLSLDESA